MRILNSNVVKVLLSLAVSLLAGYLAFRGVRLREVITSLHQVSIMLIALVLLLVVAGQILRSVRWGLLLAPIQPVSQRLLLPITCVGFLFVWILPARLGELARPYLLRQNSTVDLSAAMGTVVLERLIDASFLVILLALCLPVLRLPSWLLTSVKGFVYVLIAAVLLLLLGSLPWFRERLMQLIFKLLPARFSSALSQVVDTFYSGMQAVTSMSRFLFILGLTLVIWSTNVLAYSMLFDAMDLQLGWLAAITVLVLTCLGIALPAAPGFIGNYHYACVVALALFGVAKETALAFGIMVHFFILVVIVLMGITALNAANLKVGFSLKRQEFVEEE